MGTKTSKHQDPTTANNVLLAGLAVQAFCFIVFLSLFAYLIFNTAISRIFPGGNDHCKGRPLTLSIGRLQRPRLPRNDFQACRDQSGRIWISKQPRGIPWESGVRAGCGSGGDLGGLASRQVANWGSGSQT